MVDPINVVTQSVISAFLETSLKAIAEKLRKGRRLTEVETLTLLMNERFRAVDEQFKIVDNRFSAMDDRLKAIETRLTSVKAHLRIVDDIAQLKTEVA